MLLHSCSRLTICRDSQRLKQHHLFLQQSRSFRPSRRKLQDALPNHYETLELPASASVAEIKKQFYALSKKYHPDVNPEPSASEKFVKISEAYHVLGSAEKKGKYDRDFQRAYHHHHHHHHRHAPHTQSGSHSSHARSPAGGRPASGLSKRRSQFRGPPPSFYAQGGYGTQGSRRQRAQADADAWQQQQHPPGGLGSQPNFTGTGGFSPGSDESPYFSPDPDMPYFDQANHRRTHDNLGARRESKMNADATPQVDPSTIGGSTIANFFIVAAVVATATVAATTIVDFVRGSGQGRRRRDVRDNG